MENLNENPESEIEDDRPIKPALLRGWRRKCPNCGSGPLFIGYLRVRDTCPVCQEELFHQRADDGPAWATILVTGHLVAPLMLFMFHTFHPEGWMMALGFSVVFLLLALFMLPRVKGMFVAVQWAKRLYGFNTKHVSAPQISDT